MSAVLTGMMWYDIQDPKIIPRVENAYSYPHPQEPNELFSTYVVVGDRIGVPYGDRGKLHHIMGHQKFEDRTVSEPTSKPILLTGLTLRPYQDKALTETLQYLDDGGTSFNLSGNPGSGKSVMVSAIIAKLGVKTLIIAHLSMLTTQLKEEIEQFTDADVKILSKGDEELADISIATSQFISLNPDIWYKIKKHVGLIVVDEAESLASMTTMRILQRSHAKYRIAITATFTRSVDGRTPALTDMIGHKVITLVNDKLIKPTVIAVRCNEFFQAPMNKNYYKRCLVSFFRKNQKSIFSMIRKIVLSSLKKDRQLLIATDLNECQIEYTEGLEAYKVRCGIMNGKTKAKDRPVILKKFDNKELDVLLGFGVLNAGLSIPRISVIVRVSTPSNIEKLEQLIGRGRRDFKGKDGMYFIDFMFGGFSRANDKRRAFYRKKVREEDWKFFETSWESFQKQL